MEDANNKTKTLSCYDMFLQLIEQNDHLKNDSWCSAMLLFLAKSHHEEGFTHEEFAYNLDQAVKHYKSLWQ